MLDARPCSAGHTACYISPYGDVYPCVQFPLPTGNVRRQRFDEIWNAFAAADRRPEHPDAGSADLFDLQSHVHVLAMPGPRLHGRQHARAVIGRLREVAGAGDARRPRVPTTHRPATKECWHERRETRSGQPATRSNRRRRANGRIKSPRSRGSRSSKPWRSRAGRSTRRAACKFVKKNS